MNKPNAPGEGSELPALGMREMTHEELLAFADKLAKGYAKGVVERAELKEILEEKEDFINAQEEELNELKAALSSPQQEWIDCKQKLPPLLTPVWAWDGSDSVIRILTKNGWKASMGGSVYQISHWQPYSPPAPPVTAEGTKEKI